MRKLRRVQKSGNVQNDEKVEKEKIGKQDKCNMEKLEK